MRKLDGVFRFTEWLDSAASCREWFRWFASRGIPSAIIRCVRAHGGVRYAVFRAGDEQGGDHPNEISTTDIMAIVTQTPGFTLRWKESANALD